MNSTDVIALQYNSQTECHVLNRGNLFILHTEMSISSALKGNWYLAVGEIRAIQEKPLNPSHTWKNFCWYILYIKVSPGNHRETIKPFTHQ